MILAEGYGAPIHAINMESNRITFKADPTEKVPRLSWSLHCQPFMWRSALHGLMMRSQILKSSVARKIIILSLLVNYLVMIQK